MSRALPAIASALMLWLVLALPSLPRDLGPQAVRALPLELPLIVLTLAAVGNGRAGFVLRVALVAVLTLVTVLKLADLAMAEVVGRPFNPVADLALIDASARMITGSFGLATIIGLSALCVAIIAGLAALLWMATGVWSRMPVPRGTAALTVGALVIALALWPRPDLALPAGMSLGVDTTRFAAARADLSLRTLTDLRAFRQAARDDPLAGQPGALAAIDRDVLIVFVESYGRTSFDTPFYAGTHLATLRHAERQLAEAGLAMRSGFLVAPTAGGQSWLSHASFASGLWIDDQSRYRAYLASGRQTLFHDAREAGFRTAAVMPAITQPWPESARMGFDRVFPARDLGYRGLPFNWVTMPDQFTLTATDRLLRSDSGGRLFAQVALISSHAPWVPVPRMLPWDAIGDGTEFDTMATAGPTPKQIWADRDTVRAQYRLAIDYALQAITGYALLHAADPPLIMVIGDHQAAARIALTENRDVPIHLIGPAHLVAPAAEWGLSPGLIPQDGSAAIPMDRMRALIHDSYRQKPGPGPMAQGS